MDRVTLGRTGINVNKNGFGALPIQRVPMETAVKILQKAYNNGIDFYDTARVYSDSEEKLGEALSSVRKNIYISTKTQAQTGEELYSDLKISLTNLKTDYVDILQFHNPAFVPRPGDGTGLYEAMLKVKEEGKVRFIGITNHRINVALEAAKSGLYDTLQYPFSYLASEEELALVKLCREENVGFLAMKALSGGLITDSAAAYAYLNEFSYVLPLWGIQKESELDEFLSYQDKPPVHSEAVTERIKKDRKELMGEFCRGCGYCLPCPAGIDIPSCARMSLLLRRSPTEKFLTKEGQEKMEAINDCIHCNHCKDHCPYGLDTPELLKRNLEDYLTFLK